MNVTRIMPGKGVCVSMRPLTIDDDREQELTKGKGQAETQHDAIADALVEGRSDHCGDA